MNLTRNSITSFATDTRWKALVLGDAQDSWECPVLGWATVVHWAESEHADAPSDLHETSLEPVLLVEDEFPVTRREYLRDLVGNVEIKILPVEDGGAR